MSNTDLIRRVAAELPHVDVKAHHVASARRRGCIVPTRQFEDGAYEYPLSAVEGLKRYMLMRSRTARKQMAAASAQ